MKEYIENRIKELENYHQENKNYYDEYEEYRICSLIIELENSLEYLINLENNKTL